MNKKTTIIAENIRRLRQKLGLTQLVLSQKSGVNYNTLIKIESGAIKAPVSDIVLKLAETLNTSVEYLNTIPNHFMNRVQITEKELLPLDKLSPENFEILCFDLVEDMSAKGDDIKHWGGAGDKGKDIRKTSEDTLHYYQCKRTTKVNYDLFKVEVTKIKKDSHKLKGKKLKIITFFTTKKVSPQVIEQVEDLVKSEFKNVSVEFKGPVELNKMIRDREDIANRFFNIFGLERIFESIEKFISRQEEVNVGIKFIEEEIKSLKNESLDESASELEVEIKKTSKLINEGKLKEARNILLEIKSKAKSNKLKAKILNNIGVTYNLSVSPDEQSEAIKFFEEATLLDESFIKPKVNVIIWELYKGNDIEKKEAFNKAKRLWELQKQSEEKHLILRTYLDAYYFANGGKNAYDLINTDPEISKEINNNLDTKYFFAALSIEIGKIDEGIILSDELLKEKYDPNILFLKARGLLLRAQLSSKVSDYSLIPFFQKFDDIDNALNIINEIFKVINKNTHPYLYEQSRLSLVTILTWKRESSKVSEILSEKIDESLIPEYEGKTKRAIELGNLLERREFVTALNYVLEGNSWHKDVSLSNRLSVVRTFFMFGAIDEAITLLDSIIQHDPSIKDTEETIWYLYSVAYGLLNDKVGAITSAQKAIQIAKSTKKDNETIKEALSNYAAAANRFISDHEVDRVLETSFELQKMAPDKKIIWEIKPFDENKNITPELKKIFDDNRIRYEGVKNTFISQPVIIYFLERERILNRPLIDIISNNFDPEFTIEFNFNGTDFKTKDFESFKNVQTITFDYLALLDLAKTGLLKNLNKLGKKVIIHRSLFEKVQQELLEFESEELRSVWNFLRTNKQIEIVNTIFEHTKGKLFDEWLEDSIELSILNNLFYITSDSRLRQYLLSKNISSANILTLSLSLTEQGFLDDRMYSSIIGKLAERFYVFLPFSGEDLVEITSQDNFKLTYRSQHLIGQIHRAGSDLNSFMNVFFNFINKLWSLAILPEDKVFWLKYITEVYVRFIREKGIDKMEIRDPEIRTSMEIFAHMWIDAINISNIEDLEQIEKYLVTNTTPELDGFKDLVKNHLKDKREKLKKLTTN